MGEQYFAAEPRSAARPRPVGFTVAGHEYALTAGRGVFSAGRLDPGTAVLLRKAPLPTAAEPGPLLDLGCGYGPIAAVLARHAPGAPVYAVDVNARARELAAANVPGATVCAPEAVPPGLRFRQIWSNPPIRVGKEELHAMLRAWLPRLAGDGVAWLVVARHLGGDSLAQWLTDQGHPVHRHASQKGFRVLRVQPRAAV